MKRMKDGRLKGMKDGRKKKKNDRWKGRKDGWMSRKMKLKEEGKGRKQGRKEIKKYILMKKGRGKRSRTNTMWDQAHYTFVFFSFTMK